MGTKRGILGVCSWHKCPSFLSNYTSVVLIFTGSQQFEETDLELIHLRWSHFSWSFKNFHFSPQKMFHKKSAQQRVSVLVLGQTPTQLIESCLNLRKSCIFCLLIHKLQIETHSSQKHYKAQREPVECLTLRTHLKTAANMLVNHHLSIITRVTKPILTMSP